MYNENDLQEAFEMGYKQASNSYDEQDLQEAFEMGYKSASTVYQALSSKSASNKLESFLSKLSVPKLKRTLYEINSKQNVPYNYLDSPGYNLNKHMQNLSENAVASSDTTSLIKKYTRTKLRGDTSYLNKPLSSKIEESVPLYMKEYKIDRQAAKQKIYASRKDMLVSKRNYLKEVKKAPYTFKDIDIPEVNSNEIQVHSGGGKNFLNDFIKGKVKGNTFDHSSDSGIYVTPSVYNDAQLSTHPNSPYIEKSLHYMDEPGTLSAKIDKKHILSKSNADGKEGGFEGFIPHDKVKYLSNAKVTSPIKN